MCEEIESYLNITPKKIRTEEILKLKKSIESRNNENTLANIKSRTGGYYKEFTRLAPYIWNQTYSNENRSKGATDKNEL
ncbi:hypothetical protein QUQ16_000170 [Escherichia coli]|nr:hypothetical protein [Escherichia coli]